MAELAEPISMPRYGDFNSFNQYLKEEERRFEKLDQTRIIRFPRADGYALYFVKSINPPILRHIPYGDAWTVEPPLIRGLLPEDLKQMLEKERVLRELFS